MIAKRGRCATLGYRRHPLGEAETFCAAEDADQLRRITLLGSWVNKGYLGCECETAFEMVDAKRRLRW